MTGHEAAFGLQEQWDYAPTELWRVERVKRALYAYDLTAAVDVPFILSVLDRAGLFHEPIPAPMTTSKSIRRAAQAAARRLGRRIEDIRAVGHVPANDRERRLVENWPLCGPTALKMQQENIRSATYQTFRGGRVVPIGPYAGRRPEHEFTYALLMVECHFSQAKPEWSYADGIRCLTAIVRALDDRQDNARVVEARIRQRLREAHKHEALRIGKHEYLDALSTIVVTEEMQAMRQRQSQFYEMLGVCLSPDISESVKEKTAARLGPLFRVS